MQILNAKKVEKNTINSFFTRERKSFPSYFKIRELQAQYEEGNLYVIIQGDIYGFYVLENEKFKNLYITKEKRKSGIIEYIMQVVKYENNLITIAINEKSRRMKKFVKKYGFVSTEKTVRGKESELMIYEYRKLNFIENY